MSEKLQSPEAKVLSAQEQDHLDQERLFMEDYPAPEVAQLSPEQLAEKIAELEVLYDAFEHTHDLNALNAMQASTPEEAYANPVREAAKKDLPAIVTLKTFLDRQPDISTEVRQRLHTRYQRIHAAVGAFHGDHIDHSIRG